MTDEERATLHALSARLDAEHAARVEYSATNDERWRQFNAWALQVRQRLHDLSGELAGLTLHGNSADLRRARQEALAAGPNTPAAEAPVRIPNDKRAHVMAIVDELLSRL